MHVFIIAWILIRDHLGVVAIEKRAFGSPSTKVANFTYFTIYIYIYICVCVCVYIYIYIYRERERERNSRFW